MCRVVLRARPGAVRRERTECPQSAGSSPAHGVSGRGGFGSVIGAGYAHAVPVGQREISGHPFGVAAVHDRRAVDRGGEAGGKGCACPDR
jgi:hypothetical protein